MKTLFLVILFTTTSIYSIPDEDEIPCSFTSSGKFEPKLSSSKHYTDSISRGFKKIEDLVSHLLQERHIVITKIKRAEAWDISPEHIKRKRLRHLN